MKAFLDWANRRNSLEETSRTTIDRIAAMLIISDRLQLQGRNYLYDLSAHFSIPLVDWIKSVSEDSIVLRKYPIGNDTTFIFYAYLGISLAKFIIKFELLKDLNFEKLIFDMRTIERQAIEILEGCFPNEDATNEVFNKFSPRYITQFWFDTLQFDAELLNLSKSEQVSLNHYLHSNWLIMQCIKEVRMKISEKTLNDLEWRMLTIDAEYTA